MTTKKKLILALAAVLVAAYAFWYWWTAPDKAMQQDGLRVKPKPTPVTIESLVSDCRDSTDRNFPDRNIVDYNADEKILTIAVWIDDMDYAAAYAMIGTSGTLDAWEELVADLENAGAAWQNAFDRSGFSDVTVVMHLLDPSDQSRALISVARGRLIYDVVGEYLDGK